MKRNRLVSSILFSLTVSLSIGNAQNDSNPPHTTFLHDNPDVTLTRFAFGSCWKSSRSQEHWPVILANKPLFWLWLGDNIYGDTHDMDVLRTKYGKLRNTPGYMNLRKACPVLAIWDDHDYGQNDAGRDYPQRKASQKVFLEFFDEPKDSPRWKRPGIYTSYYFGKGNKRAQVILLDTRYFRSPLKRIKGKPPYRRMGRWTPDTSPTATFLGEAQWKWLEGELKKPAQLRIIGTSIQFSAPFNGYESWSNIPAEKQRMIDLIKSTRAEGVVFISGDIHSSELCIEEPNGCYPLADHTSSSLNTPLGAASTHRRIGPAFGGANFGLVEINWEKKDPTISFSTKDTKNDTRLHHSIALSELTFTPQNLTSKTTPKDYAGTWQTFYGPMTITQKNDQWQAVCANRKATLTQGPSGLVGTWQGNNRSGNVIFRLSRNGQFLYGSYSDGNLPQQLDWAGWKADWETHFKRDDYHQKNKK